MSTCRCGCVADAHLHHRAGTDCGHCGPERCEAFVPDDFTDDQAAAYLALAPFALPMDDIPEDPVTTPDPADPADLDDAAQEDLTADDHLVENTEKGDDGADRDLVQPVQDPDAIPHSVVDENGHPA